MQNLISNAIKYTPEGHVLVGCRRRGDKLRIEVYDTGIGIPQAKRRAVFKEFHRLDQGARVARGVGLGLSIVERIARVLDCEVKLRSNAGDGAGHGSRFSIEVPRAAAAPRRAKTRAVPRPDIGRLDGMVVLCIDNERAILDGMETLLNGWNCRALTAADLTEALAAINASGIEPDGLLVDYHLDDGNGIGAIVELRRRLGRHDLAGDPDHGRPLAPCPRGGARRGRACAQQAAEAGVAARADHAVARAARRRGIRA